MFCPLPWCFVPAYLPTKLPSVARPALLGPAVPCLGHLRRLLPPVASTCVSLDRTPLLAQTPPPLLPCLVHRGLPAQPVLLGLVLPAGVVVVMVAAWRVLAAAAEEEERWEADHRQGPACSRVCRDQRQLAWE
jgi:hypothetical protein